MKISKNKAFSAKYNLVNGHYLTIFLLLLCTNFAKAEITGSRVYNIFQANCTTSGCHNHNEKAGNLDLQGGGETPEQDVGSFLYKGTPNNEISQLENDYLVYPGQPYRSNIFNYIANNNNANVELHDLEDPTHLHRNLDVSELEQEIIRQWILEGANANVNVDLQAETEQITLLEKFYNGEGAWSINPLNPPAKPAADEGFQIRIGPIFLKPSDIVGGNLTDVVYNARYDFLNEEAIEINRIAAYIGASHHFIGYEYINKNLALAEPYGFIEDKAHNNKKNFGTFQESTDYMLPTGTAIYWEEETILDFQTHTTNYSEDLVLAYDVYLNVYTQQAGTASQELKFKYYKNTGIAIPPNVDSYQEQNVIYSENEEDREMYVWAMHSHTHLYGLDYDVFLRNADGTKGEHIYDASYYNGIPTCEWIGYNYETPPIRKFGSPLLHIDMLNGMIQEATYFNDTNQTLVYGGSSTENEMMLVSFAYVSDTMGVSFDKGSICYADEINGISSVENVENLNVTIFPNPIKEQAQINIASYFAGEMTATLYDLNGQVRRQEKLFIPSNNQIYSFLFEKKSLQSGIYFYEISDQKGNRKVERIIVGE